ncbi:DUF5701 family protein [Dietzia sp. 179-F 9C3 NHS]|uniref:DUF5701 family protein n=1 Tax=Dietzia sp. 179-F 9C3 NHS TaxID=3374295 RepID=UPI003878F9CE
MVGHCPLLTTSSPVATEASGRCSAGAGRPERRGAPEVGWCRALNHHTWLGLASTVGRVSPGAPGQA